MADPAKHAALGRTGLSPAVLLCVVLSTPAQPLLVQVSPIANATQASRVKTAGPAESVSLGNTRPPQAAGPARYVRQAHSQKRSQCP